MNNYSSNETTYCSAQWANIMSRVGGGDCQPTVKLSQEILRCDVTLTLVQCNPWQNCQIKNNVSLSGPTFTICFLMKIVNVKKFHTLQI